MILLGQTFFDLQFFRPSRFDHIGQFNWIYLLCDLQIFWNYFWPSNFLKLFLTFKFFDIIFDLQIFWIYFLTLNFFWVYFLTFKFFVFIFWPSILWLYFLNFKLLGPQFFKLKFNSVAFKYSHFLIFYMLSIIYLKVTKLNFS